MGDETDALNDMIEDGTCFNYADEPQPRLDTAKSNLATRIKDLNRAAKIGTTIKCPTCGRLFVKKSYQQVFCRNKGRNNCKDRYWNISDGARRERAIHWA